MARLIIFFAVSAFAVYVSRAALREPRSHGLPRIFAWECILVLLLLNFRGLDEWFRDPLSARQIASWILLSTSLLPIGLGVYEFRRHGQADAATRRDPTLFPIEQTTRLVTTGVYRHIRHPMYASLLILTWGVFLKRPSALGAAWATGASVFLLLTAAAEERENVSYFGDAYDAYRRKTKRFIPFVF